MKCITQASQQIVGTNVRRQQAHGPLQEIADADEEAHIINNELDNPGTGQDRAL